MNDVINAMTQAMRPESKKLSEMADGTRFTLIGVQVSDGRYGAQATGYTIEGNRLYLPAVYVEWAQRVNTTPVWRDQLAQGMQFEKFTTTLQDGRTCARMQYVGQ